MSSADQPHRLALARRALDDASRTVGVPPPARGDTRPGRGPLATGITALDAALGGGLPRGRIVEITGARSSGRLSLTLALLSRALHAGEAAALVDVPDALDPRALPPDDRERLLWVRPPDALTALRCVDLLLDAGGFGVVALYLVGVGSAPARRGRSNNTDDHDAARRRAHAARPRDPAHTTHETVGVTGRRGIGAAAWARLAQRARRAHCVLVVALDAASPHAPGPFAYAALAVRKHRAAWRGRGLLETVATEIAVSRNKLGGATGAVAEVTFRTG